MEKDKIAEIYGHPDASNIFSCLMEVINREDSNEGSIPLDRLAGFTSDGASVMISPKERILGKLQRAVNHKNSSTHCLPHRLVLASKEAKKSSQVT